MRKVEKQVNFRLDLYHVNFIAACQTVDSSHTRECKQFFLYFRPGILVQIKVLDPEAGPQQLQNKVQFDIRYYFARRGGENIYEMTKNTFKVVTDPETDIAYITRAVDEETKNHKETDSAIISGIHARNARE